MQYTKEQLLRANEINKFILDYCDEYHYDDELILSDETIEAVVKSESSLDKFYYSFPIDGGIELSIEELLALESEIKSIEVNEKKSIIKTNLLRYYILESYDDFSKELLGNSFIRYSNDKLSLNLINESLLIGLVAVKSEEYDKHFWGTVNQYLALEVTYKDSKAILSEKEEIALINSFLFEVADSTNYALSFGEISCPSIDDDYFDEEDDLSNIKLRELIPVNYGMHLFTSAIQIDDPELKFLSFYKVIEHFSPIAVNIESNELMRKKLDSPRQNFENGDFIRSVFELANSMQAKFNDEDLIKTAFKTCFDFAGLFDLLPESIKKNVKKTVRVQNINYETKNQDLNTAIDMVAKTIYKTRNQVVHAKSNFNSTGEEVKLHEFDELNLFMKQASSQTIRWYNRQPEHLKLTVI